jgi:four helix bundle suffix protein
MIMERDNKKKGFIPQHGGFANLLTYKRSEIIYDGTVKFTGHYYSKFDRTAIQMVQAARSGKQNIAEGSMIAGVSRESEIKLTGVARASLEELRLDYEDLLRNKGFQIWEKSHRCVSRFRELNKTPEANYETFRKALEHENLEVRANAFVCLIRITTFLLKRQIDALEAAFVANGGLRENMRLARLKNRESNL